MSVMDRNAFSKLAQNVETRTITVSEWKGTVRIRAMSVADRALLDNCFRNGQPPVDWREVLVAKCLVGPDGNRLFEDEERGELSELPANGMEVVCRACMELNGIAQSDAPKD